MMIAKKSISFIVVIVFTIFSNFSFAENKNQPEQTLGNPVDTQEEIDAYIQHHLQDAHDFVLFTNGNTGNHIGFPLPIIIWDEELHFFSSSKFHHGESVAESNGKYYVLFHEKIYRTDAEGTLTLDDHNHPTNVRPLDFSITKSVVGMLLIGTLMLLIFGALARDYKKGPLPTGFSRVLEPLVLYVRDEIARPNIGEKKYRNYMSFLLTVFFFIWFLNLLGLMPFGFNVTGNIAVTVCLALFTMIIYMSSGTKEFWIHILWMPGVPYILRPVLAIIELIGYVLIKPFSLLIRLFANITAGHVVVMSLIALMITLKAAFGPVVSTGMSLFLTLFISIIEILIAFLQAFIFTMLSSLFIGMAVAEHDHH
ncbi:MAG: F0F1 ATP synthase subunit A [Cyclobacteriaceae bacterium]|nr:F0F1 ATP synthase subunit A [Cyclobacteriaceae bacterium]